ncbi:MAG: hypothetical protein K6C34_01680 [Alphaproteobacteria bacterium]|nr:hypothetical protein [Alphaproteobacteria bacterium]
MIRLVVCVVIVFLELPVNAQHYLPRDGCEIKDTKKAALPLLPSNELQPRQPLRTDRRYYA